MGFEFVIKAGVKAVIQGAKSDITRATTGTSHVFTGSLGRTPVIDQFERLTTKFIKQNVFDPIQRGYIERINAVPVTGVAKEELPILRMVHESMFEMLKCTKGKSPLFKGITFEQVRTNGVMRQQGVACVNRYTGILKVNRDYFENIDLNINDDLKKFMDSGWITKDKNGTYKIADYLRNSKSEVFEKRLNEYTSNWPLEYKFLFHRTSMNYYANLTYQASRQPQIMIEKIMKTGNNQQKLQKLGLFKTRTEVMQMSKEEQIAYLKQIGTHCPPTVDTCLVTYPGQVFNHECIHRYHFDNISDKMYSDLHSNIPEWTTSEKVQTAVAKVSGYAGTSPCEYVAEVGSGLANGQQFDNDVISLYESLKGPKL